MELNIKVEEPSKISRKLTIKVPAQIVAKRFERGLAEAQKTAKLKGFRPGQAPISVIRQYFGEDVRHRVFHSLIDESYREALRSKKILAIGAPQIETPDHKTGEGEHDHTLKEDQELSFTATVEILPEVEVKGYTGLAVTKEPTEVTEDQISQVINGLLDSNAQLEPVAGGLVGADGKPSSRPAIKGDYVDMAFSGGLVTEKGLKELPGMKGTRVVEIGSDSLIPGFEDNLIGMRAGETKTFKLKFPAEYHEKELAGQDSEFTATVNELKEKKLPTLDDEFAKTMGYEGVTDLKTKARTHLEQQKQEESDRKLRSDILQQVIEKNPFEVPAALIESQTRSLAQDWAQELKQQGIGDQVIQNAIGSEIANIRVRAENQVRASLLLDAIVKKEKLELPADALDAEIKRSAVTMQIEEQKLRDFYAKNPARQEDMEFKLKQESAVKFLLDKAKIKSKS